MIRASYDLREYIERALPGLADHAMLTGIADMLDAQAPADVSGLVELEAWVTIGCNPDGGQAGTSVCGSRHAAESAASHARMAGRAAKVVRLTGYTAPPTPEAVETVAGVVS